MLFILSEKLFIFRRQLSFSPYFLSHVGKRLDKTVKVNFKIYDIIDWETNDYRTYTAQYL